MAQDLSGDELGMLRQKVDGWQTYKVGREVVKKVGDDKVGSIVRYSYHSVSNALTCSITQLSTATCNYC